MPADPSRVLADLADLRTLTSNADGAQRVAFTPVWQQARIWFRTKLNALPVEQHVDAAGNLWATLRGRSPLSIVLGSHLDSIPGGGWLDGCLGVLTGLEILRSLADTYKDGPPFTIRLVDWADEEGARFGRSLFGSSAFAGTLRFDEDRFRTDADGNTLEKALRACDIDIDRIADAERERTDIAAYLELHIEQGPILEMLGTPIGAVLGTKGVERHTVTFLGESAHSGSTPMASRHDAFACAARFALELRSIAGRHPDAVSTIGAVKTSPGIVTAIVGRCDVTLDQRDLDADVLQSMLTEAHESSRRIAREEGCFVEWSHTMSIEPIPFHPELIALCEEAIAEVGCSPCRLPSGPLHDAAEVARVGIPTAMMFVNSIGGISHNKIEDTRTADLSLAIRAFDVLATKTLRWMEGRCVETS
ncbi:MAG: Zn-dependent hydrolase [Acidobacteriota bacterium]|nr:Zn-dependent hydrolase [Acidobacteriota bacterium]